MGAPGVPCMRTSGQEAVLFGLVGAADEAHELGHDVAVEVGRPEAVLRHRPARREHHKIRRHPACTKHYPLKIKSCASNLERPLYPLLMPIPSKSGMCHLSQIDILKTTPKPRATCRGFVNLSEHCEKGSRSGFGLLLANFGNILVALPALLYPKCDSVQV